MSKGVNHTSLKMTSTHEMEFSQGSYYVGDLGYILSDNDWDELCEITKLGNWKERRFGTFMLSSGVMFAIFSTIHGDGEYEDQYGNSYRVDSATIGCIPFLIENGDTKGHTNGHIFEFTKPFLASSTKDEIIIGNIYISLN